MLLDVNERRRISCGLAADWRAPSYSLSMPQITSEQADAVFQMLIVAAEPSPPFSLTYAVAQALGDTEPTHTLTERATDDGIHYRFLWLDSDRIGLVTGEGEASWTSDERGRSRPARQYSTTAEPEHRISASIWRRSSIRTVELKHTRYVIDERFDERHFEGVVYATLDDETEIRVPAYEWPRSETDRAQIEAMQVELLRLR